MVIRQSPDQKARRGQRGDQMAKATVECPKCKSGDVHCMLHVWCEVPSHVREHGVKRGAKLNVGDAIVDHFWCNGCESELQEVNPV